MCRLMNRLWRLLATAFSFGLFGVGALLLTLAWFPWLRLACRSQARRRELAQGTIRHSFRFFLGVLSGLGVMSYKIEGAERLALDGGSLLVANHPSLIDYVLLASVAPRCDCIVKQALWQHPCFGGVIRAAGYLPNGEGEQLLAACRQRLAAGGLLLIFPEGTRTTPGQPLRLQRGAANIAVRCGADLRLAHILCQPSTLTKQESWYHIPTRKPHFHVMIGDKVAVAPFLCVAPSVAARQLTEFLTQALLPASGVLHGKPDEHTTTRDQTTDYR